MVVTILKKGASLAGEDLSRVIRFTKKYPVSDLDGAVIYKKNEDLNSVGKSVLKHRIGELTGRNAQEIEKEMGYDQLKGNPMDIQTLKRFIYFAILEANGELTDSYKPSSPSPPPPVELGKTKENLEKPLESNEKSKMNSTLSLVSSSTSINKETPTKKSKTTRRTTMMPALMTKSDNNDTIIQNNVDASASSLQRKSRRKSMMPLVGRDIEDSTTASPAKIPKKKAAPPSPIKTPPKPPKLSFSGSKSNEIFLCKSINYSGIRRLKNKEICRELPFNFPGFHLSVIRPSDHAWMTPDYFLALESIVNINRVKKLDQFSILIQTDILEINDLIQLLKNKFTKHHQTIFLNVKDEEKSHPFMLDEASITVYILAYFFPDCHKEKSQPDLKIVNSGFSTSLEAKNQEEGENMIVLSLSGDNDWILVLNGHVNQCEIVLAAQKIGRFAVSVDNDEKYLDILQDKAAAIASYHDKNFRNIDGDVIQLQNFDDDDE